MNWFGYALLGSLFAGLTSVLIAAGLKGIDSYLATAVRTVMILPVVWIMATWRSDLSSITGWNRRNWFFLGFSAVASGLSWVFAYKAIDLAGAAKPAPIDKASLLFTIVLAAIFLHERITPRVALAGLFVLAGVMVYVLPWKSLDRW